MGKQYPNRLVKIVRNGEALWVHVADLADQENEYYGFLRNDPLLNPESFGDRIVFHVQEVVASFDEDKNSMN